MQTISNHPYSVNYNLPALGGGAGLRHPHLAEVAKRRPEIKWFEVISEDFVDVGGEASELLQEISKHYSIIGHGVCLSIGSTDPLNMSFLKRLRCFLDAIKSPWASDHLAFTMVDHTNLNDLCPLPFTQDCVKNCVERIKIIQNELARPFLIENITRYLTVSEREMLEVDFINEIVERSGCGLLLDITNVLLNSRFHGFDPYEFIAGLPLNRVGQMHLSGWDSTRAVIIDSHDAPVPVEVWELFKYTIGLSGPTSVLVERDGNLPALAELVAEAQKADSEMWQATGFQKVRAHGA